MKAKAIVFDKPNSAVLQDIELQDCGADEVLAETIFSFVSPGTELRVFNGNQPDINFPLIPGYSWVGRVIEVGKNIKGWQQGELVSGRNSIPVAGIEYCWGGQASHHRCDPAETIIKLPEGAEPWEYIHAEVASISHRGVTAAYPKPGETAVVIGQGMIGAFNTKWLLLHGAKVIAIDIEDFRLELAKKWGVEAALNANDPDIREKILSYFNDGADIVIESSASMAGAKLAASLLRKPAPQAMGLRYDVETIHSNANIWPRLVFQASYHPIVETKPQGLQEVEGVVVIQPFDRSVEDRQAVVEHIRKGNLPASDIIDAPRPVSDAPYAYTELQDNPDKMMGLAFEWK